MAGASGSLHESPEALSADAFDKHRALVSLQEELEAVDWYNQRAEGATGSGEEAGESVHKDGSLGIGSLRTGR